MANKLPIAFLCHPYHRGGVTRWMADAAIAYSQRGHEVFFATLEPTIEFHSGKNRETMLQLLAKEPNKVKVVKQGVAREFEFGTPDYCAYVYKKLLKDNIPLGTAIILSDDAMVWNAAISMHASYPIVGVLHADEQVYYDLAKAHPDTSDIFVCVSDRVNRTAQTQVPRIDASRFFTIPCGINLPSITYSQHRGDILNLVYVGRISDYQKRTGDLLKVVQELAQQNTAFHLTIIGDGTTARPALEQSFKDAKMDQYVTFTGWLSQQEVHRYLTDSDVLVLTSDFEGMPIAMMEGLAAGCGFVGTRVSGIEDYADHPLAPDCFSVFEVGDIVDAARKILKMGAVPISARQTAARKLAESQFSMKTCLDNYLSAIESIPPRSYSATNVSVSSSVVIKSKMISMARAMKMSMKG